MKILQVIPYFSWPHGGPVRVAYELSRQLSIDGHDVTIFTTDAGGGMDGLINTSEEDFSVRAFPCIYPRMADALKLQVSRQMNVALRDTIGDFDIIHMHEWRGIPNYYAWKCARKQNVPYVVQGHGAARLQLERQTLLQTLAKKGFDSICGREIICGSSKVIALTESEARIYTQLGIDLEKVVIIPNGVDLSLLNSNSEMGLFRTQYNLGTAPFILYLGRLHKSKGIDVLVDAFLEIRNARPEAKMVVAGPDDGYQGSLKNQVCRLGLDDSIIFTGFLSDVWKHAALVDSDIFVTPSYSGFPLTFLEACAMGKPVVTTENGDELEWLNDRVGYVTKFDSRSLAAAIISLLRDDDLRNKFGTNGRDLVRQRFNWPSIACQLEKMYLECLE